MKKQINNLKVGIFYWSLILIIYGIFLYFFNDKYVLLSYFYHFFLLLFPIILILSKKESFNSLGFRKGNIKEGIKYVILFAVVSIISSYFKTTIPFQIGLFSLVIFWSPLTEEIFHRGYLLSGILPRLKSGASNEELTSNIVPNSTTTASKSEISRSDIISKGVNSGLSDPIKDSKEKDYLKLSVRSHPTLERCGFSRLRDKFSLKYGVLYGLIISSIMFGLIHIPKLLFVDGLSTGNFFIQLISLSIAGGVLGYVYQETKSLFYPIIIHSILNLSFFL